MSQAVQLPSSTALLLEPGDTVLSTPRDLSNLIGDILSVDASAVIIPIELLDPAFFDLCSGFAGEVLQKVAIARKKLALVGDVSVYREASKAFNDLVIESRFASGYHFLSTIDEAVDWLTASKTLG